MNISRVRKSIGIFFISIACLLTIYIALFVFSKPSNYREWRVDQAVLATSIISGDNITINNVRNFRYTTETEFTVDYNDREYQLSDLLSVDYIVEPFAGMGAAHTFVSFGFGNGEYIAISVEARRQPNEEYSPFVGILPSYELMYVIADERDVINLRANFRKNDVFLYPVQATIVEKRTLFTDMLERANKLAEEPEFYHTLFSSCSVNIARHVNKIAPNSIPWDIRLIAPKNSDEIAYELGLIDNSATLDELRQKYKINERAQKLAYDEDFSFKIRNSGV